MQMNNAMEFFVPVGSIAQLVERRSSPINMNLVFHISEDDSEIKLKHCRPQRQALSRHENISCT